MADRQARSRRRQLLRPVTSSLQGSLWQQRKAPLTRRASRTIGGTGQRTFFSAAKAVSCRERETSTASRKPGVMTMSGSGDGSARGLGCVTAAAAAAAAATAAAMAAVGISALAPAAAVTVSELSRPTPGACDVSSAAAAAAEELSSRSSRPAAGSRLRLRDGAEPAKLRLSREVLARFFVDDASFACRVDRVFATGGDLVRFRAGGLNWRSAWGTSAGFVRVSATDAASAADRRTRCSLMRHKGDTARARRARPAAPCCSVSWY